MQDQRRQGVIGTHAQAFRDKKAEQDQNPESGEIEDEACVFSYHPLLVTLHWLLALLITGMLIMRFFILATTPNTDAGKIDGMSR